MKTLTTTLVLSALFFVSPAIAGGGHEHGHSHVQAPVNQATAEKNADEAIASLLEKGKLEKSWSSIKASSVDKKVFNDRPEWVVIYINKKVVNPDQQKLYVFLTISGDYIAANYTGN